VKIALKNTHLMVFWEIWRKIAKNFFAKSVKS